MSQETHAARWIGFRQPVLRVALEKQGEKFDHDLAGARGAGLGQVWEEDEFWIELSWRDRSRRLARHPQVLRVAVPPGEKLTHRRVTTAGSSRTACPACPRRPQKRGADAARVHAQVRRVPRSRTTSTDVHESRSQVQRSRRARPSIATTNIVTKNGAAVGVEIDGKACVGFPDAVAQARVLLEDAQGLEVAGARDAGLHPEPRPLDEHRPRRRARWCCCRPSGCRR